MYCNTIAIVKMSSIVRDSVKCGCGRRMRTADGGRRMADGGRRMRTADKTKDKTKKNLKNTEINIKIKIIS